MDTKLNKPDYIILGLYLLVSLGMMIKDYQNDDNELIEFFLDIPARVFAITGVIIVFIKYIIGLAVVKKSYIQFVVYGLATLIFFGGIEFTIRYWTGGDSWAKFPDIFNFISYAIENGAMESSFPFALILSKKFYESQVKFIKIQKETKENELKLLRAQLDPHFLFNNLNTLDALIDTNPEGAKEFVNKLSSVYRYLIKTKDSGIMELDKELNFAENYIFLIKTRFEEDYIFKFNIENDLTNKYIPTSALQMLLENVVKHNKANNQKKIIVDILIADDFIQVKNTRPTNLTKQSVSTIQSGLNNLIARYKHLTDHQVIIQNTKEFYSIQIPILNLN